MADAKKMTNEFTLVGILESISEIEERGSKGTEIIRVRVKQPGKYENVFDIEFMNDRIDDVLEFEDEDIPGKPIEDDLRVRIRASVNGRLWQPTLKEDKTQPDPNREPILFLSITGWSIKRDEEPVKTKGQDRRAARKAGAGKHEEDDGMPGGEMPGGDDVPTPNENKSEKRKSKTKPIEEEAKIKEEDDMPY